MDKKEKLLPQLLAYAGKRKVLTYLSMVIAGISQLLALAPFLYIWALATLFSAVFIFIWPLRHSFHRLLISKQPRDTLFTRFQNHLAL